MPQSVLPISIRPARREDIPAIVRCALTSTTEGETIGFGRPRSEQTFADEARLGAAWGEPNTVHSAEILVAEFVGQVVGYVIVEDRGEVLELNNIDVSGDSQRKGVGSQIVRAVEERARRGGKSAVTLGTSRNAAGTAWRSLPWWLSLGYRVTTEEENAWTRSIGIGVREIRMRKELL